ncbi:MAG: nickel pincer cofactor biosynthesis protein LarC [Planctomycetes bacterium]|nr:nickel pincer cofactor biosynthesis protein LarC [Planctomycetota bacterium]
MRIAYLDCSSGISGDMTLAALIDSGASLSDIQQSIDSMALGAKLSVSQVRKRGFRALKLHIVAPLDPVHRDLEQILACITGAKLSPGARRIAVRIFERLAKAESSVHGVSIDQVHFHEVGAIDSIVDIVGCAVAWDQLGIEQAVASPVPTGCGFVQIAHGRVSVPAPATAQLLKGIPLAKCNLPFELTTPTGAAILAELIGSFGPLPSMQIESIGAGAGTMDLEDRPNLLRIFIGSSPQDSTSVGISSDTVVELETNLDDITGEQIGFAIEQLWSAGALDVFTTGIQMKKNRPGTLLSVLASPDQATRIEQVLFQHTGTLGIRKTLKQRSILRRRHIQVDTPWGKVDCKMVIHPDGSFGFSPEYESCREIALKHGLKLSEVIRAIEPPKESGL